MQLEHTIEIQKIITGGCGLGRLGDGMVVMTPFVLPGEQVKIVETKRYSGHAQARPLRIERPGPERRPPFCPHYTVCGGCALQHTSYSNQLAIKKDIVAETLARGHVQPEEEIPPTLPSPNPQGYRHRIRLHVEQDGRLGFHKMRSNKLVAIQQCPLAAPEINTVLQRLYRLELLPELARFCSRLELTCSPADRSVTAILHLSGTRLPARSLHEKILAESGLRGLGVKVGKKTRFFPKPVTLQQLFSIHGRNYTLEWDSRCFFQVNPEQNGRLVELVTDCAGDVNGKTILDLFCGMGNFSIPLALAGAEVTGVEHNSHSISQARDNARKTKMVQCRFISGDAGIQLNHLLKKQARFDLILLDPPRQGLGRAASLPARLGAAKILYISCDPATFCRDLRTLTGEGYSLKSVTPVDMFPQTHHIECLAVLEKN